MGDGRDNGILNSRTISRGPTGLLQGQATLRKKNVTWGSDLSVETGETTRGGKEGERRRGAARPCGHKRLKEISTGGPTGIVGGIPVYIWAWRFY